MSSINGLASALNNPMAFRLAQTYGAKAPQQVSQPLPTGQVQPAGRIDPAQQVTEAAPTTDPTKIGRLVGAVVPGKIDFSGDQPAQTGSLSLYRHPADRNVAATGIELGRVVDLQG